MSAQDMTENKNGGRKIGTLRVEKDFNGAGNLVFTFNEVVKDKDDKVVSKTALASWENDAKAMPQVILDRAMEHGFLQKFGDALAGKKEYPFLVAH